MLVYTNEQLESMLMARKNITYQKPQGWLARMIHTLISRLIFASYLLRNAVQEVFAVLASSLVALIAFALAFLLRRQVWQAMLVIYLIMI